MGLKPIVDRDTFVEEHLHFDRRVKEYSATKRGKVRVADIVLEDLMHRSTLLLRATNASARIAVVDATQELLAATARQSGNAVHWVTLAPSKFVMDLQEAERFDWSAVQQWAYEVLEGFNFFGIVDLAVYTNAPDDPYAKRVSFHLHLEMFDVEDERWKKRREAINEIWSPFLVGGSTAHSRRLPTERRLSESIYYMMKAPLRTYRVYRVPTGKLFDDKWEQKKARHQPGVAVSVCEILQGIDIPSLCVAGGVCTRFPEIVAASSLQKLRTRNTPSILRGHCHSPVVTLS